MRIFALLLAAPLIAVAMPVKTQMLKPRAFFQEAEGNLLTALDLKAKTLTFKKKDFDQCGANLVRKAQSLTYSCTLPIETKAEVSKLQNLMTAAKVETSFGSSKREVQVAVSPDAKTLTFSTSFDHTGIDFEVFKFNDDFYAVYAKAAQLTISEAMSKQPVRIEVLENR